MIIQETASLITRDGIRLDADIYRPDTEEKLPVLLMSIQKAPKQKVF